ncbi:IclR family transcriptional regulator [Pseudonocardia sp. MH-G8]|uniref:IclR family transcriptional regulator n=1 Tax=Pseudonocardia sp. MH-G8 TaxID=1854588 RepID=UPI000BA09B68|nr:IclR family transcriptional regulator [Pseudonocardia sp. MH-G8]OZM75754.1 IclR family transcriptional regulator [Pseudonocardia sp. MH-G8]
MVSSDGLVRSVDRVVSLLELLGSRRTPMRLMEIAQALEIPKSTAHGLLQTLMAKDLVVRDEAQRYRIGIRLFSLAAAALDMIDLRDLARAPMEELSATTGCTCNLAVLDAHQVLYIEKVEDRTSALRLVTQIGTRLPAHATALGKVLVAALPDPELRGWLADHEFVPLTPRTIAEADAFARELEKQAEVGYAVDNHEFHAAVTGVAAPVRDHTGATIAALSLSCLEPVDDHQIKGLAASVVAAARAISVALRSSGP